jgi:hypothetical protein
LYMYESLMKRYDIMVSCMTLLNRLLKMYCVSDKETRIYTAGVLSGVRIW